MWRGGEGVEVDGESELLVEDGRGGDGDGDCECGGTETLLGSLACECDGGDVGRAAASEHDGVIIRRSV